MKSGLYTAPGDSATARAAATASRLAEPTMKLSKRCRGSTCIDNLPRGRAQALEHQLGDAAQRLEHPGTVQGVSPKFRDTAKVERVVQLRRRENEIARQILLVVLNHQRHRPRLDSLFGEIRVQV